MIEMLKYGLAICSCVVALVAPAFADDAANGQIPPGFDKYLGCEKTLRQATGFFRVEKIGDRWWFITPDGHPFFSAGINVLRFSGTPTKDGKKHYEESAKRIYATPEAWADVQFARCLRWGGNTVGCWSDWQLFRNRMPYTVILSVGNHDWQTGRQADIFSEEYRQFVRARVKEIAGPLVDDPYLIGYFLDNEMKWGPDHRGGHLFDQFFAKPIAKSATKAALVRFLKDRYETIERLKADFSTEAKSWQELEQLTSLPAQKTSGSEKTRQAWAGEMAREFFTVTDKELRAVDPHHLNLGVRFISQLVPRPVIVEAGKHVDVMSINYYDLIGNLEDMLKRISPDYLPVTDSLAEHYRVGGRPILVTEWSYRAADAGLPNSWPPIYPTVPNQKARADAFEAYVQKLIEKPWFVGHHWFLYADQPREGRFDGENNNFGLVSEKDEPYELLVERSAKMLPLSYEKLSSGDDASK
jgi:hypothetical protein